MFKRDQVLAPCFLLCMLLAPGSGSALAADSLYSCGHDFNNDGELTQTGETADCILTDAGDPFCSLAPAECLVVQKDAACPEGTTLNTVTHRCESEPACSSGSYDRNSKTCILVTPATCPENSTLNGTIDRCQADPSCASGLYDPRQDMCVETSDKACPNNTIMNSSSGKCEAEPVCLKGVYSQAYNACVFHGTGDPSCPPGSVLNRTTDRCEASPECDTGTYDASSDLCINSVMTTNATCPQGTTNNLKRDVCEGSGTCAANTAFDSTYKVCAAAPSCGIGLGSYVPTLDKCYTSGSGDLLNTVGFIFSSLGPFSCEANTNRTGAVDTCTPQVKHDETVARINAILAQLGIAASCPALTTLDQSSLLCAQHPMCAEGSTLDLGSHACIATPFCEQGVYDLASHKCVIVFNDTFVPVCPAGTSKLDPISDTCISDARCPAGTSFNPATNKCETRIGCPSGIYDTANNYCVSDSDVLCPASTSFNRASGKCEASYSCPSGSAYDQGSKTCSYGSGPVPMTCPGSGSYNSFFGVCQVAVWAWESCPSPYTFWFWDGRWGVACKASPTCPENYSLSGGQCYPKPAVAVICPAGTAFDAASALCKADPACPLGSIYNPATKGCSTVVNPICVVDTMINTATDLCEAAPTCLNGFGFRSVAHRCEAVPVCPAGSHYDSARETCLQDNGYADASCPDDTALNPATDWCEGIPLCSPGAVYSRTTRQCEAAPTCPVGTVKFTSFAWDLYDAPGHKYAYCDIPATTSSATCIPGTTLDPDIDRCITTVQCPSGSFFNPATQWCEADPSCPANSYYYPSLGLCVTTTNSRPSCPGGMSFNGVMDLCIQTPGCPSGSYDKANDICTINSITNPICPSGTAVSASTGKCVGNTQCLNGGVYDAALNQCVRKTYPNCVSSLMLNKSNDSCETVPSCPPNTGSYDSISNQCMLSTAPVCPLTLSLDPASDMCSTIPSCSTGNFDPATNLCRNTGGTPTAAACPAGTSLNIQLNACAADPLCSTGGYNPYLDKCSAPPACASGAYNKTTDLCDTGQGTTAPPVCPSGMVLDPLTDVCVAVPVCPSGAGFSPTADKCVAAPGCPDGSSVFDPSIDMCVPFLKTCPYNTATTTYACPLVNGKQVCSPDPCFDRSQPLPPPPTNNLTDDGPVDPDTGKCLGQIRIFNGTSQRCLPPGQRVVTADCCAMPIPEDIYNETSNPYNRFQRTVVDPLGLLSTDQLRMLTDYLGAFQGGCDMNEMLLNIAMKDKRTHFIGQYCLVKWLAWCVQKAQMHCIFNSTLSRIIHEQGRPQLKRFGPDGGWGTPEQPNCEGFRIDEFQMLDFSRIDLSEFIALIKERVITNLSDAVVDKTGTFYEETLPNFTNGGGTTN